MRSDKAEEYRDPIQQMLMMMQLIVVVAFNL